MFLPRQGLRKTIRSHFSRGNVFQPNDPVLNRIPDEVMMKINMLALE